MSIIVEIKKYEKMVSNIYDSPNNFTMEWMSRYHVSSSNRRHLVQIVDDILKRPPCKVLDQGAAEGVICRILQDKKYSTFALDRELSFAKCWQKIGIKGVVGDCMSLDWWDGSKYDVIIAGVWVACKGRKAKSLNRTKIDNLTITRDNWISLLKTKGVVYFDVNKAKYPLKQVKRIFCSSFVIEDFAKKPRTVLKCMKK